MGVPRWAAVGNKVKFKYNVTWDCEGTITHIDSSSSLTKIKMSDVTIDENKYYTYIFHVLSIKGPSIIW